MAEVNIQTFVLHDKKLWERDGDEWVRKIKPIHGKDSRLIFFSQDGKVIHMTPVIRHEDGTIEIRTKNISSYYVVQCLPLEIKSALEKKVDETVDMTKDEVKNTINTVDTINKDVKNKIGFFRKILRKWGF